MVNRDRTLNGVVFEDEVAAAVAHGSSVLPLNSDALPVTAPETTVHELFTAAATYRAPIVVLDEDRRVQGIIPRVTLLAALGVPAAVEEQVGSGPTTRSGSNGGQEAEMLLDSTTAGAGGELR